MIESIESQWLATVALFPKDSYYSDRILRATKPCQRVYIGIVNRRHRLFLENDLLLFLTSNGDGRYPVWCRTSRNYSVRGLYLGVSIKPEIKVCGQLGHFDVVDPEELAGFSPAASDVRRYVVAYAQARVRSQVGVGNLTVSGVSTG
jgi:hypothetical protein